MGGFISQTWACIEEAWKRTFELIQPWPWATIAAFLAVAVTMWVARSESRRQRRQLQQNAILDINYQSSAWINAAGEFLAYVSTYLERGGTTTLPWSLTVLGPITSATNDMDRALKSAHMVCSNFGVIAHVSQTEQAIASFLDLLNGPHPQDAQGLRDELTTVLSTGRQLHKDFGETTRDLVNSGFEAYALPKSLTYRVRRRCAIVRKKLERRS